MNAVSCIQSTHVDDPSCEDALEEHDDPKMDRAGQPVQPHMDMVALGWGWPVRLVTWRIRRELK